MTRTLWCVRLTAAPTSGPYPAPSRRVAEEWAREYDEVPWCGAVVDVWPGTPDEWAADLRRVYLRGANVQPGDTLLIPALGPRQVTALTPHTNRPSPAIQHPPGTRTAVVTGFPGSWDLTPDDIVEVAPTPSTVARDHRPWRRTWTDPRAVHLTAA